MNPQTTRTIEHKLHWTSKAYWIPGANKTDTIWPGVGWLAFIIGSFSFTVGGLYKNYDKPRPNMWWK